MVAFPFTLFFVSAFYVVGVSTFVSVIIGGLWVIGSYFFFEDQIKLDLIFKKEVRTNHPQSTYDNTNESRNSHHIESGDKKQSEWKCNHVRSPHRARHDIASDVCIASCGASACISRRNIECGESNNDLHRNQCVDNPCRCLPQKRLTLV